MNQLLFQFPFQECTWHLNLYDIQQFEDIISTHKNFHSIEISQFLLHMISKVNWSQIISYENPERIAFVNQFTVTEIIFIFLLLLYCWVNLVMWRVNVISDFILKMKIKIRYIRFSLHITNLTDHNCILK